MTSRTTSQTTPPAVTVVTPTKNRCDSLIRALDSVRSQAGVVVEHIVVGDDCQSLANPSFSQHLAQEYPEVKVVNVRPQDRPEELQDYKPARLSTLRNLGVTMGTGRYVAHLDDDNRFEEDHLTSLVQLLEASPEVPVAHSWRHLVRADGTPFLIGHTDPWFPTEQGRRESFKRLAAAGVLESGSSVVKDRLRHGTEVVARVDTSEYLIRRAFYVDHPFPVRFSRGQQLLEMTEDMAFSHLLVRLRVPVVCSERATLAYTMGGYSNIDAVDDTAPAGQTPVQGERGSHV